MAQQDMMERIENTRNGSNPALICRMPSGWLVMCDMQYLNGYCILLADPPVESINHLNEEDRAQFCLNMSRVGDALLKVTGALQINYAILGNADPLLHAHIIPRYNSEPESIRRHLPWSYPAEHLHSKPFDVERDRDLMQQLANAIQMC